MTRHQARLGSLKDSSRGIHRWVGPQVPAGAVRIKRVHPQARAAFQRSQFSAAAVIPRDA